MNNLKTAFGISGVTIPEEPELHCPLLEWRCVTGFVSDTRHAVYPYQRKCIKEYERCDGHWDCMDGSDEDGDHCGKQNVYIADIDKFCNPTI